MRPDESDSTHFWIYCPGCAYQGKIGVPKNHPAEVVVCPQCREVVSISPENRILWQPAGEDEFWEGRFGVSDNGDDQQYGWVQEPEFQRSPVYDEEPRFRGLKGLMMFLVIMWFVFWGLATPIQFLLRFVGSL